jgi:hypothetical protein
MTEAVEKLTKNSEDDRAHPIAEVVFVVNLAKDLVYVRYEGMNRG